MKGTLCVRLLRLRPFRARIGSSLGVLQRVVVHAFVVLCACCVESLVADRSDMTASRLLAAAAACVMLSSFAAGHSKSYWGGRIKAAIVICQ